MNRHGVRLSVREYRNGRAFLRLHAFTRGGIQSATIAPLQADFRSRVLWRREKWARDAGCGLDCCAISYQGHTEAHSSLCLSASVCRISTSR